MFSGLRTTQSVDLRACGKRLRTMEIDLKSPAMLRKQRKATVCDQISARGRISRFAKGLFELVLALGDCLDLKIPLKLSKHGLRKDNADC